MDEAYSKCQKQIIKLKEYLQQKRSNTDKEIIKNHDKQLKSTKKLLKRDRLNIRCYRKLRGHLDKIYALNWSKKENNLLSASQDGQLMIKNVYSQKTVLIIKLYRVWVMTCSYSPTSKFVASGGLGNLVEIFNIEHKTGSMECGTMRNSMIELVGHLGYISDAKFIDDNCILSCSGDGSCKLWDIEKVKCIQTCDGMKGDAVKLDININRSLFAVGSMDDNVYIHDYRMNISNKWIARFSGHESDVNAVKWFPDKTAFITGSDDSTVRLWDIRCMQQLNKYHENDIYGTVTSIDSSKSGRYIISGYCQEPYCLMWNTITCEIEKTFDHLSRVSCLEVQPNGASVATGSWDKVIRCWVTV